MINLSCGQHMMLLNNNNTPVHVCCVDMAELCVSCGKVSQKGNRRVVFRDSNCSHLTIYAAIFSLCDEAESVLKQITTKERYMCRSCFRKYDHMNDLSRELSNGLKSYIKHLDPVLPRDQPSQSPSTGSRSLNGPVTPLPAAKRLKFTQTDGSPPVAVS